MSYCATADCGKYTDLLFPEPACHRHITDEHRAMLDTARTGGRRVGIKDDCWPYGPNIHIPSRLALIEWAEKHGYREARPTVGCMHWIVGKIRRCRALTNPFNHHGVINILDGVWDHVTYWARDGKPALILAQPYCKPPADWIARTTAEWPVDVEVTEEAPWYGYDTHGVLITPRA